MRGAKRGQLQAGALARAALWLKWGPLGMGSRCQGDVSVCVSGVRAQHPAAPSLLLWQQVASEGRVTSEGRATQEHRGCHMSLRAGSPTTGDQGQPWAAFSSPRGYGGPGCWHSEGP